MTKQTFLITGASDGIGAVYADRLARRGHDLILVARRADKLAALADQLRSETGVAVDVIAADLANPDDLARVEARLRTDDAITGLINNAGIAGETSFVEADTAQLTTLIDLNILAVTRLSAAIAPAACRQGRRRDRQHHFGHRADARRLHRGLSRQQGLCARVYRGVAGRTRRQGRARSGGGAGHHPHPDLGRGSNSPASPPRW